VIAEAQWHGGVWRKDKFYQVSFKCDKTYYAKYEVLKACFHNDIMRRTQASECYLCLKRAQTSAVYSVISGRASSPTAETAKICTMPPTNADGGRLKIFLTLYVIMQYILTEELNKKQIVVTFVPQLPNDCHQQTQICLCMNMWHQAKEDRNFFFMVATIDTTCRYSYQPVWRNIRRYCSNSSRFVSRAKDSRNVSSRNAQCRSRIAVTGE